jgi:hypothetical protein
MRQLPSLRLPAVQRSGWALVAAIYPRPTQIASNFVVGYSYGWVGSDLITIGGFHILFSFGGFF